MSFDVLPHHHLEEEITYHQPDHDRAHRLGLGDAAMSVMTDLKKISAVTIGGGESIEKAEERMIRKGVRMLVVSTGDDMIQGIITATDLAGEKPMLFIQKNGGTHKDILVKDLMSKGAQLEVLQIKDVSQAKIGDIVETLKVADRQHALVVDHQGPKGERTLRGIFSLNQIARKLGIDLREFEVAHTLAEIAHHTRV